MQRLSKKELKDIIYKKVQCKFLTSTSDNKIKIFLHLTNLFLCASKIVKLCQDFYNATPYFNAFNTLH